MLCETERAAGGNDLLQTHRWLTEQRREQTILQRRARETHEELERLQKLNAGIQRDMQRIKEREALETEVRQLDVRIAILDYEDKKEKYQEMRLKKDELQQEINTFNERHAPMLAMQQQSKKEAAAFDTTANEHKAQFSKRLVGIKKLMEESEVKGDEVTALQERIAGSRKRREKRKAELREAEMLVRQLQKSVDESQRHCASQGIPVDDQHVLMQSQQDLPFMKKWTEDMQRANAKAAEIQSSMSEVRQRLAGAGEESQRVRRQYDNTTKDLKALDNIRNRRIAALKQREPQVYDAFEWLAQNQRMFVERVFDPVCLEVELTDTKYAAAVEAAIKRSNMSFFVVQSRQDYETFTREVLDKQRLKVTCFWPGNKTLADYWPEVSTEAIKALGFDGYVLDFMTGPEPVLVALCEHANVHRIPVALAKVDYTSKGVEQDQRIQNFISNNTSYTVKRAYGQSSTRSIAISDAVYFGQSVDMEAKTRLEENCGRIKTRLDEIEQETKRLGIEEGALRVEKTKWESVKTNIANERRTILEQVKHHRTLIRELQTAQDALQNKRQMVEDQEDSTPNTLRKILVIAQERGRLAYALRNAYSKSVKHFTERTECILKTIERLASVEELERAMRNANDQVADKRRMVNVYDERLALLKASAKQAHIALKTAKEKMREDEEIEEEDFKGMEELIVLRGQKNAQLQMTVDLDPRILQEYDERERQVEVLRIEAVEQMEVLQTRTDEIKRVKDTWSSKLQDIVGRISETFSESFEAIGCAGELRVEEDEDFAKWRIGILVKFRDTEELQPLTATRQSGGERSVTTMLYLLALQKLSQSPFRVVDEINQGMDPRNERLVHRLIVNAACEQQSSQYFLVTPKLLNDLTYHDKMTVLCIFNGVGLPDDSIDLASALKQKSSLLNFIK